MNSCFIFIRADSLVLRFKKVKSMKRFNSDLYQSTLYTNKKQNCLCQETKNHHSFVLELTVRVTSFLIKIVEIN